ncbi:MAG: hypothetical protein DYH02_04305 [Candidatus Omnitrophica bacterium COP1]|nr:hypothetical protein [Candidatus Omnitrophica bacterium COP1]
MDPGSNLPGYSGTKPPCIARNKWINSISFSKYLWKYLIKISNTGILESFFPLKFHFNID